MRRIVFEGSAFEDFVNWGKQDKKLQTKIVHLIKDIDQEPFRRLGKPEPLRHKLSGYWSRHINQEHRLVYKVTDKAIIIISCKYNYG